MELKRIALIGDVGGTNIRLQLISIDLSLNNPAGLLKETIYKVADYDVFQKALEAFLADVGLENYPEVAAIGIAGPITDNTVFMANAEKWGVLNGNQLG
jgi:glucokinase